MDVTGAEGHRSRRDAFDQHVFVTEKPGGLYEEIIMRAPRVSTARSIASRTSIPRSPRRSREQLRRLEAVPIGATSGHSRPRATTSQRFIGTVIRHRQRGADLVWEAYNVDIGGTE